MEVPITSKDGTSGDVTSDAPPTVAASLCVLTSEEELRYLRRGGSFVCGQCGKAFSRKFDFKVHSRVHTGFRPYRCGQCGRRFSQQTNLNTHLKTKHFEEELGNRFHCQLCQKSFAHRHHLVSHLRSHSGAKPFSCLVCKASFSDQSNMKRHLRRKHAETLEQKKSMNVFRCEVCGRCFGVQSHLEGHLETHGK